MSSALDLEEICMNLQQIYDALSIYTESVGEERVGAENVNEPWAYANLATRLGRYESLLNCSLREMEVEIANLDQIVNAKCATKKEEKQHERTESI